MKKSNLELLFPNLSDGSYAITSPATVDYNCIAWAANDSEACWWPDPQHIGYWPAGVPRVAALEVFIKAYGTLGYICCCDATLENGFDKVALYVDTNGTPTHAARQLSNGCWTSKLGKLEDIEHQTLEGLSGHAYGTIAVILKRPKE